MPPSAAAARCPSESHCRQNLSNIRSDGEPGPHDEIFGVVASPETGAIVRIFRTMPRDHSNPAALGRMAAKMLLSQGAGALLTPAAGAAK